MRVLRSLVGQRFIDFYEASISNYIAGLFKLPTCSGHTFAGMSFQIYFGWEEVIFREMSWSFLFCAFRVRFRFVMYSGEVVLAGRRFERQ